MDGALEGGGIKPAATSGTAGNRAEFVAAFGQAFAGVVEQFGGEGAGTDAGGVGLHDAEHIIQGLRRHARTGRGSACQTVGRSNKGISAVVNIQQRALRTFKQQAFAALDGVMQAARHVGEHRQNTLFEGVDFGHHVIKLHGFCAMQVLQLHVIHFKVGAQFVGQELGIGQIAQADGAAGYLVFVSRADAAAGGADFAGAFGGFAGMIERNVVGQNHRAGGGDVQPTGYVFHAGRS